MHKQKNASEYARELFVKSATSLQNGDPETAKKGLLKVAKLLPDSAVVWYNLGLCYQYLEQHQKAVEVYGKSLRITPGQVDALVNMAISQKVLGQETLADKSAMQALSIDPEHSRALNLLGSIAAEKGSYEPAKNYFEKSLNVNPESTETIINLASLELDHNNPERAMQVSEKLILADPDNKQVKSLRAKILLNQKRFEEAATVVLELESEYPEDEETMRLNLTYREVIRDHFGTIAIAEKLLKQFPGDAGIWNSLGGAYFQLDGVEKSRECYEKAISLNPDHPEYENNAGLTYSALGDKDNAEHHFRRSIELNPNHAEAYRNLVTMKRFKSMDDPDAIKVKSLWEQENLDDFSAIKASFALGKVYDDCGLYDEAFKVYKKGNDIKFRESKIDLEKYFGHMDRIQQVLSQPPVCVSTRQTFPSPIFVLGMPRSGTTLVEQIITRHSDVQGCGELPCIERAITRLEKKSQPMKIYPDDFISIDKLDLDREVEQYLEWVKRLHEIRSPFFTDKMPFNFVHIWLIKAMFPESAIVHCQRHPLDVITSNYFQLYGSDVSFVYNLEALANYYVRYQRLTTHWSNLFGDGVYNIQYEALVSDAESETRKLIDAVKLEWQDSCLDQNQSGNAVRTASIWQVRQGIYTRSKERWRHYGKYLGEVIEILAQEKILDEKGNWLVWEQRD